MWAEGGSWLLVLGTDGVGRDMLSRLIYGARVSLFIGLDGDGVSFGLGVVLGLAFPLFLRCARRCLHHTGDGPHHVGPDLVLAILAVAILGPSTNTIVAVTIVFLPRYVRLVRASALGELDKDYVTAARVAGSAPYA